jgi:hypothetical protein
LLTQLETYHEIYSPLFQRQEQRYWSLTYMQGQMLDIERGGENKNQLTRLNVVALDFLLK